MSTVSTWTVLPREVAVAWTDYKLADAIEGWNGRKGIDRPFIDYCCDRYPGSIVCDYRRRTTSFYDVSVLADIVRRRASLYHNEERGCRSLPHPSEVVLHLRLGDTSGDGSYTKPLSLYRHLVGRNVTVVTNVQRTRAKDEETHRDLFAKSVLYAKRLERFLTKSESASFVTYRTSCLPDEDFVFLTHASHFEEGRGGYSAMAKRVHQKVRELKHPLSPIREHMKNSFNNKRTKKNKKR